jgi:pilus assembly protein CpaB
MRDKRFIIAILGALGFGLIAALSVGRYLASARTLGPETMKVVVTKLDIPVGTKLIAEQLATIQLPTATTPAGSFQSPEKLVGRVTLSGIAARELITEPKLAPEGAAGGLSAVIPDGFRAMTVKVDEVVGVSGFINPGTAVDVVCVIQPPESSKSKETISKIVLQNIKVLASGQNIDRPKNDRETAAVRSVTMQVTPEQAEKLALAGSEGRLQLVMRNSGDQQDEKTHGANKRSLLTGETMSSVSETAAPSTQPKPAPVRRVVARPRPVAADSGKPKEVPRPSVEVFVGAKRTTIEFP